MERNIGARERPVRGALAVTGAVLALWGFQRGNPSLAAVGVAAAVGFGINTVTCFCATYRLLGIDTTGD